MAELGRQEEEDEVTTEVEATPTKDANRPEMKMTPEKGENEESKEDIGISRMSDRKQKQELALKDSENEQRQRAWILAISYTGIMIGFEGISVALRAQLAMYGETLVLVTYELLLGSLIGFILSQFTIARPKRKGTGPSIGSGLALALWTLGSFFFVRKEVQIPTQVDTTKILQVLEASFRDLKAAIQFAFGRSPLKPRASIISAENFAQFQRIEPVSKLATLWATFEPLGTATFLSDDSSTLSSSITAIFAASFVYFVLGDTTKVSFLFASETPAHDQSAHDTTFLFEAILALIPFVMGALAATWTKAAGPENRLPILSFTAAALTLPYTLVLHGISGTFFCFYATSNSSFSLLALLFLSAGASHCAREARLRSYAFLPSTTAAVALGTLRAFVFLLSLGIIPFGAASSSQQLPFDNSTAVSNFSLPSSTS